MTQDSNAMKPEFYLHTIVYEGRSDELSWEEKRRLLLKKMGAQEISGSGDEVLFLEKMLLTQEGFLDPISH